MTTDGWTCPRCGRRFANANQWHSCGRYTVEDHLTGTAGPLRDIYERVVAAARKCGEVRIDPVRTAIELRAVTAFAAVKIRKRWIDLALMTLHPIDSPRAAKAIQYGPTAYEVTVRLTSADEVDDQVANWPCEAYAASEIRRGG